MKGGRGKGREEAESTDLFLAEEAGMIGRHTQEMPQTYGGQEGISENRGWMGR